MNQELQTVNAGHLANPMELTPEAIVNQVRTIQSLMGSVMKIEEHYGTIPGCKKPSLFKSGAEKLSLMFRLAPEYVINQTEMPNGHRDIAVTCNIKHIGSGAFLGSGVGSCSTMESKYRWRAGKLPDTPTEFDVPKAYWDKKKAGASPADLSEMLGQVVGEPGKYGTKKIDEQWKIVKRGEGSEEREENKDIADQYNTVLKMAKKRAHVDAILTVTAASDIFTQDVEDLPPMAEVVRTEPKPQPEQEKPNPKASPAPTIPEIVKGEVAEIDSVEELEKYKTWLSTQNPVWKTQETADIIANRRRQLQDAQEIRAMERAH